MLGHFELTFQAIYSYSIGYTGIELPLRPVHFVRRTSSNAWNSAYDNNSLGGLF